LLVDLINESLKEVKCILLLTDVDRSVSPKSENLPEPLGDVVLQLTFHKMAEDLLDLVEKAAVKKTFKQTTMERK